MNESAPRWSTSTKRTIVVVILVLIALILYRFRVVIPPLVIAFLLAFILDPIADFLGDRLHFSRGLATVLVFLILILAMLGAMVAPVTAVPSIQRAVRSVQIDIIRIIADIGAFFEQPVEIGGHSLDLSKVYEELSAMLSRFVSSVAQGTLDIAFSIASGAFWLIFILMAAFYLVKDADRIVEQLDSLAPPGYRDDFARLRQQITEVWSAFLRGQLLLGLALATITTIACLAVGLPYAGALGLLAGVMEFVPSLGPIIAMIPAVLLALFQGSAFLPLSNFWFAVLVAGLYIVIQQIESNLLLPRILGRSLNLHPLLVLIAIIVAAWPASWGCSWPPRCSRPCASWGTTSSAVSTTATPSPSRRRRHRLLSRGCSSVHGKQPCAGFKKEQSREWNKMPKVRKRENTRCKQWKSLS